MKRLLGFLALVIASVGLSGCATQVSRPLTCALILMREGKQVVPTTAEFDRIAPKVSRLLLQQGMVLTRDIVTADRLVTIASESRLDAPGLSDLRVLDIAKNTFTAANPPKRLPDLSIGASQDGTFRGEKLGIPMDYERK